ncbi:helix-turn-helix domain-containing protein [Streptomyces laculatispora]|uniref:Helix-turn-helix domain-containing protein n=1 Tax=Streptomyces laculatispora TaxID=887464 RepID=A0ABY9IEA4_9ACTN|nr:helix-turn-helix domain-containing protein [Streptomyces laculatispora]WLQ45130.1 helix-turn-helix domain-containing protein [Streptomyces laculatispora]
MRSSEGRRSGLSVGATTVSKHKHSWVVEGGGSSCRLRAFRFALDPSSAQEEQLLRWCGNARLAFNYALVAR